MDTTKFSTSANNECKAVRITPDQKSIKSILASAKKKPLKGYAVVIARYKWLLKHNLPIPLEMELPNLCLTIKEGNLERAFYSNVMTNIIKKQKYNIQILN